MWLFREHPELLRRAEAGELACGTIDSWLIARLTGGTTHATDPTDRAAAYSWLSERQAAGEVPTGLLYLEESGGEEMHEVLGTVERPLVDLAFEEHCPGSEALDEIQRRFR